MKNKITILFLFLSTFCLAENRQHQVDSLRVVLKTNLSDTAYINCLNELSLQFYEMDSYDSAMSRAMVAKELSTKIDFKKGLATSYKRIGAIFTQKGLYPAALENLLQSLKIYESLGNKMGIFLVYNNIGTVYYFQSDYDKALQYYFKAEKNNFNPGLTYSNIGMVYGDRENYSLALKYFQKALSYYESIQDQNSSSGMINNIGACYEGKNDYQNAILYYFKALDIKRRIDDKKGICDALGSVGDIFLKQKKYSEALGYQNECLMLAKQIQYLDCMRQTENIISEIYMAIGDCPNALEHYKKYISVKDLMYNEENTKKLVVSEMNFEQAKKDAVKEEQLKRQRDIKNGFIVGFGIVIVFSVFLFRAFKRNQKAKRTIEEQKKMVEHSKKEITDSIAYAKNIQSAILPSEEYLKNNFTEHFLIYRPKDIVSGDFYWAYNDGESKYFATADCTGHGVPGAMMSMLASSLLNEIVIERKITSPEMILNVLREEIIKALNPAGSTQERKDGLDIVICKVSENKLACAGANNPIYIVRNSQLIEVKSNRFPVGKYITNLPFTLNETELQKGDIIYTLSDGYCDQFGGENGKKLMSKRFKEWVTELSVLQDMNFIKLELEGRFENWVGKGEQIDDVTVLAVKI